jgi:hypothetical protein
MISMFTPNCYAAMLHVELAPVSVSVSVSAGAPATIRFLAKIALAVLPLIFTPNQNVFFNLSGV